MCIKPEAALNPKSGEADRFLAEELAPEKLVWKNVDWMVAFWLVGMHLGALAAPFFFSWSALGVTLVLHWFTASVGICLGFHRYLSHRSLKLRAPGKALVLLAGALSAEGSPRRWAANHRLHHAKSDQHGDPHSPNGGKWWSHLWWMFLHRTEKVDDVLLSRYAPDLNSDRMVKFFDKTFVWWSIGLGALLYAVGGLPWLLWGLFARTTFCYHSTWFVNSATHLWGYRNYETRDASRNLWWVAILAYGEGWHNNHHAHPAIAPAGHKWWEIDMTMWSIRFLQLIGQAYDVKDQLPTAPTRPQEAVAPVAVVDSLPAKALSA
jgi:stearoyl-CoA desaturase (delta-9 desaturase)